MEPGIEPPFRVPRMMKPVDVIRLIYEQFRPVTKKCGPLLAGQVSIHGIEGNLYLTEYQYWLWSGDSSTKELTHSEVDALATPQALLRSLLSSTIGKMQAFEAHLGRIESRAEDVASMLGYYLSNDGETMTDAIATSSFFTLEEPEHWKRINKSSRTR